MTLVKCLSCEQSTKYLDNYKFNVNSDKEFFGEIKLYHCEECDLAFANPMPPLSKLDHFYKYVLKKWSHWCHSEKRNFRVRGNVIKFLISHL